MFKIVFTKLMKTFNSTMYSRVSIRIKSNDKNDFPPTDDCKSELVSVNILFQKQSVWSVHILPYRDWYPLFSR